MLGFVYGTIHFVRTEKMERKAGAKAACFNGRKTGRENLAYEGIWQAVL